MSDPERTSFPAMSGKTVLLLLVAGLSGILAYQVAYELTLPLWRSLGVGDQRAAAMQEFRERTEAMCPGLISGLTEAYGVAVDPSYCDCLTEQFAAVHPSFNGTNAKQANVAGRLAAARCLDAQAGLYETWVRTGHENCVWASPGQEAACTCWTRNVLRHWPDFSTHAVAVLRGEFDLTTFSRLRGDCSHDSTLVLEAVPPVTLEGLQAIVLAP